MIFPNITSEDIYNRLVSDIPTWYGNQQYGSQSIFNTMLEAYIAISSVNLEQLEFCLDQIYISTITDHQQLVLFAKDYFYNSFPQLLYENDASYRNRIRANLLAERATRPAMSDRLFDLTGYRPDIFEPWRPSDCGGYGDDGSDDYSMGYDTHGSWGDDYPYQCFIDVFVTASQSMGTYPAYLDDPVSPPYSGLGAYSDDGEPDIEDIMFYGDEELIEELITPSQIYKTIEITKVFGTVCWVNIEYVNPA